MDRQTYVFFPFSFLLSRRTTHSANIFWRRVHARPRAHTHTRLTAHGEYVSLRCSERERERERDSVVAYNLLQPARPSRPVRDRVCHFTETRAAANIHTSSLSLDSYVRISVIDNATRKLKRRLEYSTAGGGESGNSFGRELAELAELVSRESRLQRVRASVTARVVLAPSRVDRCAHRAADNAVVTTASVRPFYGSDERRTYAEGGEYNPTIPTPSRVASRRVASRGRPARPAASTDSTVARAPLLRLMIHLVRGRAESARSTIEV